MLHLRVCFSENLARLATNHLVHIDTFVEVEPLCIQTITSNLSCPARERKEPKDTVPLSMWPLLDPGFLCPVFLMDF